MFVTDDDALLADLVRLAAAAGVAPDIARGSASALRSWSTAPLVLVGADRVADLARSRPPRRARVHVVGRDGLRDELFRDALALGAESVAGLPASESWLVETLTDVGDGRAAPRCVRAIEHFLGVGLRPAEFAPATVPEAAVLSAPRAARVVDHLAS